MTKLPTFLFIDVDTQKDLIEHFGANPIPDAGDIRENLMELISFAGRNDYPIFSTMLVQNEGDFCVKESLGVEKILDTEWELRENVKETLEDSELAGGRQYIFEHSELNPWSSPLLQDAVKILEPDNIIVFGTALEGAIKELVVSLTEAGYRVWLLKDAVKGYENEEAVLAEFKARKKVSLMTTRNTLKFLSEMVF